MDTTTQITKGVKSRLEKQKIHRREPFSEVISRPLDKTTEAKIKPNDIEALKKIAIPILKANGVEKAAVFGSFARGEATESSDVDLLVKYAEHTSLFDVVRLKRNLESAIGRNVDLVSYDFIDKYLRDRVLKERIPLYE